MKLEFIELKNPIDVSLRDLILNEHFECARLGVSKEWLSKNFPEPDNYMADETAETSNIWQYGNLEFHFHEDILYMIFTDYVESVDGGPKLNLDSWNLKSGQPTYFLDWIQLLTQEQRDFKIIQKPIIDQTHIVLKDENEGPKLSFVWLDDCKNSPKKNKNPKLGAMQLWSTKYWQ